MNVPWHTIGAVVSTVAPALATALGGPLAGVAVRTICAVLGLAHDSTPDQVAVAVQQATPDQTMALQAADNAFMVRSMEVAAQVSAGQADTNKVEATSGAWFIAGWRPAVGWVCVSGLAWDQVIGPAAFSLIRLRWPAADMLHLGQDTLMPLLMSLLGLGAMRTIEKINGVAGGEVVATPRQVADRVDAPLRLGLEPMAVPVPALALPTADAPIIVPLDAPDVGGKIAPQSANFAAPGGAVQMHGRPAVMPAFPPIAPIVLTPISAAPRRAFFETMRALLFSGHLVQGQVDGLNRILDYWNATYPAGDMRHLAYAVATTWWETGHAMQPVEEAGRGVGHPYGNTRYWGRGLVQITHEENYAKLSQVCGVDLVANPDLALTWPAALPILFEGMIRGLFTGKRLADFFNATTDDALGARAIVNGTDRAEAIRAAYAVILSCLPHPAALVSVSDVPQGGVGAGYKP